MMEPGEIGVMNSKAVWSSNDQLSSVEKEKEALVSSSLSASSIADTGKPTPFVPSKDRITQVFDNSGKAKQPPRSSLKTEPAQCKLEPSPTTETSAVENNGTAKPAAATTTTASSALVNHDTAKPAAVTETTTTTTTATKKEAKSRPPLIRKDTFARRAEKEAFGSLELRAARDEYDDDGWYIYRGNGEVRSKAVTRIKVVADAASGAKLTQIPDKAFYGCSALTTVLIESDSITTVGQFAFYECSNLAEIVLPNSITAIGEYAFSGCRTLTTLQLPHSLLSIDEGTFSDCPSLTSVFVPDAMTKIGLYAFYGCRSLTNILLPASVTSIGEEAFEGCEALLRLCDPGLSLKDWLRLRYFNLPLHRLCYLPGITDLEVLVFRKQIDIVDGSKMNPLHILALNPSAALDTSCTLDMIHSMLSNSTNKHQLISAKDQQGRTPVHYACLNPYVTLTMIIAMVDKNPRACLCTEDKQNKYPTTLAIDFQRPPEIQQYLYRYQPVEAKDLRFIAMESEKKIRDLASNFISELVKKGPKLGTNFPPDEQHGWVQFASKLKEDDLIAGLASFIRECDPICAKALAYAKDYERQTAINVAVKGIKDALQSALLFCGRYDMELRPRYETKSSLVFFATDMKTGSINGSPVAIKFFMDKLDFEAEKRARLKNPEDVYSNRFNSEYVIRMVDVYDGDRDKSVQLEARKCEVPQYFMVLEQAERNLFEVIYGENTTSRSLSVCSILYELARCLQHMHNEGYVHGDFKPRNVVRQIVSQRWSIIDLDGATEIGEAMNNNRVSTAYMPPEMVKIENKEPVIQQIPAYTAFDVWSYGVVMYQMVTAKSHLFDGVDIFDSLDRAGLKKLANWDHGDVKDKLSNVNGPARDLLQKILTKKQEKRPSIDEILLDQFFQPLLMLPRLKYLLEKAESEDNKQEVAEIKLEMEGLNEELKKMNEGTNGKRGCFQDFLFRVKDSRTRRPSIGVAGDASTITEVSTRKLQQNHHHQPQARRVVPRVSRRASTGGSSAPTDYSWSGVPQAPMHVPYTGVGAKGNSNNPNDSTAPPPVMKESKAVPKTGGNKNNHGETRSDIDLNSDRKRNIFRRRKSVY